jgi:hypothetical protein
MVMKDMADIEMRLGGGNSEGVDVTRLTGSDSRLRGKGQRFQAGHGIRERDGDTPLSHSGGGKSFRF